MGKQLALESASAFEMDVLYRKITLRIVPFLVICYVVSFLDRINISYAKFQIQQDLGFGDAVYGLAAGMFAVGYVLFEVPSNMFMARYGARKTFVRIMVGWGIVSMAMMFATKSIHFYALRILLGAFEAGFYPGLMLYLTYWFPSKRYASAVSWFTAASPVAGMIGGPLSGWILRDMTGTYGLHGWQWLFFLEALPAIILGAAAYFYVSDKPSTADWLSVGEKSSLAADLSAENQMRRSDRFHSFGAALRRPLIWIFAGVYFAFCCATYGLILWLPSIVYATGVSSIFEVGLLSAIPNVAGIFGILVISRHSDKTTERRWHFFICALIGVVALLLLPFTTRSVPLTIITLSVAVIGSYSLYPIFWATPPAFLSGPATPGGLALISSVGQLAGFISPYVMGLTKDHTGSFSTGLVLMALVLLVGALAMAFFLPWRREGAVQFEKSS
ncbi:Putative tartrate transporter [Paraburkholderia sediminicola]|uniref:Tartrate transporter n=1 Tax=Paraburkholderia sediminicola TaxID=458836 RepID=A0A6J5CXC0_9BURK|nr:MFS transporter [Paraburkholderia sediminicola]CAB3745557.1 Putative tartrate transporter [Paraburkholderia sediminicola]